MPSKEPPDPAHQPADIAPRARLGVPWVGSAHVQEFLRQTLQDPTITVGYTEADGWAVEGGRRSGELSRTIWGTTEVCAERIAQALLNRAPAPWLSGALRQKAEQLDQRFDAWIWETPEVAESAMRRYSELFGAEVPSWPDVEFSFPGLPSGTPTRRISVRPELQYPLMEHNVRENVFDSARSAARAFPTPVVDRIREGFRRYYTASTAPDAAPAADRSAER